MAWALGALHASQLSLKLGQELSGIVKHCVSLAGHLSSEQELSGVVEHQTPLDSCTDLHRRAECGRGAECA